MEIIKESPPCFTDGEEKEKAGNIYWDKETGLCVYWTDNTVWQYIPKELVDFVQNETNACTALVKDYEKNRSQISGLKKDIRNAAGVAGALRDERDAARRELEDARLQITDRDKTVDSLSTAGARLRGELVLVEAANKRLNNDVKGMVKIAEGKDMELEKAGETIKELEGATYDARMDVARALDSVGGLEREAKRMAKRVAELEAALAEKSPALNPEDVVDLRVTCTVDEVLRMRAAGVL